MFGRKVGMWKLDSKTERSLALSPGQEKFVNKNVITIFERVLNETLQRCLRASSSGQEQWPMLRR